jgi:uncharacterized membrane protein YfcA
MTDLYGEIREKLFELCRCKNLLSQPVAVRARVLTAEEAIGSSLACFSVNALVSSALKLSQGFVHMPIVIPLCIGTFVGSQLGATLNGRLSSSFLKVLFGMVFIYVAYKYLSQ